MVFEGTALIAGPSFRSGPARLYTGFRGNPIPKLSNSKPPDPPLGQTRKEANFAHYRIPSPNQTVRQNCLVYRCSIAREDASSNPCTKLGHSDPFTSYEYSQIFPTGSELFPSIPIRLGRRQ